MNTYKCAKCHKETSSIWECDKCGKRYCKECVIGNNYDCRNCFPEEKPLEEIKYKQKEFGFIYGSAEVTRLTSDEKKKWVIIEIKTPKYPRGMQIYVTKTGKVRVYGGHNEEWKPSEKEKK